MISYMIQFAQKIKGLRPYVKLETALMSYSYPTEEKEITSIIFDCLATEEAEILRDYGLEPFKMKTQALYVGINYR